MTVSNVLSDPIVPIFVILGAMAVGVPAFLCGRLYESSLRRRGHRESKTFSRRDQGSRYVFNNLWSYCLNKQIPGLHMTKSDKNEYFRLLSFIDSNLHNGEEFDIEDSSLMKKEIFNIQVSLERDQISKAFELVRRSQDGDLVEVFGESKQEQDRLVATCFLLIDRYADSVKAAHVSLG